MILKQHDNKEAAYLGDITENKVGIDTANIGFITTLLTSNLYSQPLQSFFRETVANAYDSCVETGGGKIIMLVQDDNSCNETSISIRDYGTGLSPERFNTIYRNIGSSTKREDNAYIGMFGIGRMSCLACADVATINSYYNGIKYSYLMYKNGTGINIDKISEEQGDYKNGLEMSITVSYLNWRKFRDALRPLCLFENLIVNYIGEDSEKRRVVEDFNDRKIEEYDTFYTCNLYDAYSSTTACMGKVIYDGSNNYFSFRTNVIAKIPMGEVDITPNRESLQYTKLTEKTLRTVNNNVQAELSKIASEYLQNQQLSLIQWHDVYRQSILKITDTLSIIEADYKDVKGGKVDNFEVTEEFLRALNYFMTTTLPEEYVYIKKISHRKGVTCFRLLFDGTLTLFEKADKVLKGTTRSYFIENYDNAIMLTYEGWKEVCNTLKDCVKGNPCYTEHTLEEYFDFFLSKVKAIPYGNDCVPASYIEDIKAQRQAKKNSDFSVRIYHGNTYSLHQWHSLSKSKIAYIYAVNTKEDDYLRDLSKILRGLEYVRVISVPKNYLYVLENYQKAIPVEQFLMKKQKVLVKMLTFYAIKITPIYKRIYTCYYTDIQKSIIGKYRDYHPDECSKLITALYERYKKNGWLIQEDIDAFTYSDEEVKALKKVEYIRHHSSYFVNAYLFKLFGHNERLGIKMPKPLLKQNIYESI